MTAFKSRPVGRRRVLKAAGATAAAGVVGMPAIVKGQSGTIKIGVPTIQSGRVALVGQTSVGGLRSVFDSSTRRAASTAARSSWSCAIPRARRRKPPRSRAT